MSSDEDYRELLRAEIQDYINGADERIGSAYERANFHGRWNVILTAIAAGALIALAVTGVLAANGDVSPAWPAASGAVIIIAGALGRFESSRQKALYTESNAWRAWSPETKRGLALHANGPEYDYDAAVAWWHARQTERNAILDKAWDLLQRDSSRVYGRIEEEAARLQKDKSALRTATARSSARGPDGSA